jgi:hypothetical protein
MLAMYLYCMLVNNFHINKSIDIPYKEIISNGRVFRVVLCTSKVLCNETDIHARLDASYKTRNLVEYPLFAQILALSCAINLTNPIKQVPSE